MNMADPLATISIIVQGQLKWKPNKRKLEKYKIYLLFITSKIRLLQSDII